MSSFWHAVRAFSSLPTLSMMRQRRRDDDNFFKAVRQEHQSHFSPSFVFIEQGSKNFEDLLRDSRGAAEEVSVFRKVWISCIIPNPLRQLLSVFPIHSFQFFRLGCNPVIGLWQCSSIKAFFFFTHHVFWFDKIKVWSVRKCYVSNVKYNIWDFLVATTGLIQCLLHSIAAPVKYAFK